MFGSAFRDEFLRSALESAAHQAKVNMGRRGKSTVTRTPTKQIRDVVPRPAPTRTAKPAPGVLLLIKEPSSFEIRVLIYWRGQFYEGETDTTTAITAAAMPNPRTLAGALALVPIWTPVPRHRIPLEFLTP